MDPLTVGAQQLVLFACGAFFLAWVALAIGVWLARIVTDMLSDWIGD